MDPDFEASSTLTTTDGKVEFGRSENGDVCVTIRGPKPDRMVVAARVIPASEWSFITKIL